MTLPLRDLWCAVYDGDPDGGIQPGGRRRVGERRDQEGDTSATVSPDDAIIGRVKAGDREAFDAVVTQYAAELVRLATIMLRDYDAGEDAAQEVLARVWEHREQLMVRGALRPYLMRAVANHARNVRTTQANRHRLEVAEREALLPFEGDETADRDYALWAAIERLPERWRESLLLRYVQRLSFAEVGSVMHISEDAAKKVVRRAIEALRRELVTGDE